MTAHETEQAIIERLTLAALETWNGAAQSIRDEILTLAQREGLGAAVDLVEELADK